MKITRRIFAMFIAILMMLSAMVCASANTDGDELSGALGTPSDKYKDVIYTAMGISSADEAGCQYNFIGEYNADGSEVSEGESGEYVLCFFSYDVPEPVQYTEVFGNYLVNVLGYHVYSVAEGKLYTLSDAYYGDLPNMEYVLSTVGEKKYTYRERVLDLLYLNRPDIDTGEPNLMSYSEPFAYYGDDQGDEPEYVLVRVTTDTGYGMSSFDMYEDYVLCTSSMRCPFAYDLGIYVPAEDKVYDLGVAIEKDIEGIDKVFTEYGAGRLLGDMDKDRKITVRDATYIQKGLADIIQFGSEDWVHSDVIYSYSDFNRDGKRSIQDATAIQKEVAGLDWRGDGSVDEGRIFADNCVIIESNKDYPILMPEDFTEYDFDYIDLELYEDNNDKVLYRLVLKTPGKDNVLEAVEALKYREGKDFVSVSPDYIDTDN